MTIASEDIYFIRIFNIFNEKLNLNIHLKSVDGYK